MNFDNVNVNVSGSQSIIKALQNYNTIILKPNIIDNRNVLTQEMISEKHTKYVIKWNYSLEDTTIDVPKDCIIEFAGGTIDNGTIVGNNTILIYSKPIDEVCLAKRQGTFIYNTTVADEEDITSESGQLKFKDRPSTNGMGKKILRKNIVDGINILTQSMINQTNTIYVIQYDFTLGENITIPTNCVLEFNGGSISGEYILNLNNCYIIESSNALLCNCKGSISNKSLYSTTFGEAGVYDDNNVLQKALDLMLESGYTLILQGTYHISSTLRYVAHCVEKAGIRIEGVDYNHDGIEYSGSDCAIRISQSYAVDDTNYKFFFGGFIKNITIKNTSASVAGIEISSWWQGLIEGVHLIGNRLGQYGIYTPSIDAVKSPFSNPDPYATASLELKGVTIMQWTDYGIYNANPNGDPYWRLTYCKIEQNRNGIQLNSSGWIIENSSLSYNYEYSIISGDLDISGNQPNQLFCRSVEFDGTGNAALKVNAGANLIFDLCRFIYRILNNNKCQKHVVEISGISRAAQNIQLNSCTITADQNAPALGEDEYIDVFNILTNNWNNNIDGNIVKNVQFRGTPNIPSDKYRFCNVSNFYRHNTLDTLYRKQSEDKLYWLFRLNGTIIDTQDTNLNQSIISNNPAITYFDNATKILTIPDTGFYKITVYLNINTNAKNVRLVTQCWKGSSNILDDKFNFVENSNYTLLKVSESHIAFAAWQFTAGDVLSFIFRCQSIGTVSWGDGIEVSNLSRILVEKIV